MTTLNRLTKFLTFSLLGLMLVQCGKEDEQIAIDISPQRPVVITSNYTMNLGQADEVVVEGPWFSFFYSVTNNSEEPLTIVSWEYTATSSFNGQITKSTGAIDPGTIERDTDGDGVANEELPYLFVIPPKTTDSDPIQYFFGGLPKSDNHVYRVTLELQGWFGSPSQPLRRAQKVVFFTTE